MKRKKDDWWLNVRWEVEICGSRRDILCAKREFSGKYALKHPYWDGPNEAHFIIVDRLDGEKMRRLAQKIADRHNVEIVARGWKLFGEPDFEVCAVALMPFFVYETHKKPGDNPRACARFSQTGT